MKAGYYILIKKWMQALWGYSWSKEIGLTNPNRSRLQAVNISGKSYCEYILHTPSSAEHGQSKALSPFHGSEVRVLHVPMSVSMAHMHSVSPPLPMEVSVSTLQKHLLIRVHGGTITNISVIMNE